MVNIEGVEEEEASQESLCGEVEEDNVDELEFEAESLCGEEEEGDEEQEALEEDGSHEHDLFDYSSDVSY
jgi:hypothetical protein